jgi:hypothetical protein
MSAASQLQPSIDCVCFSLQRRGDGYGYGYGYGSTPSISEVKSA